MIDLLSIQEYITKHQYTFIEELKTLLRIPSISAQAAHGEDMYRCAAQVMDLLQSAGMQEAKIIPTKGCSCVYAEYIVDKKLPTVLVYGHYDVQPPDPLELWNSPPFEPVVKDGKIYARGSADNKGQFMMHVKALEMMLQHSALPCNVKVLIEGEEEIGSPHLEGLIKKHIALLACDVVLISDSAMHSLEQPTIDVGMRGLSYIQVEVSGPDHDLHSGVYGGAVPNPITILCEMIASLHDEKGRVNISHFYDKVNEVSQEERKLLSKVPYKEETFLRETGIKKVCGEEGYSSLERTGIRPTLELNGIWGGYTGEGAKTVLPAKAFAKISCRLVPHQSTEEISQLLIEHLYRLAPNSVEIKVEYFHGGNPYVTPLDHIGYEAAKKAIKKTFGKEALPMRGGGSIPIVSTFEKHLKAKTIFLGFGLNDDNLHSPNEKFAVENYLKGIETIPYFYAYYAELYAQTNS